MDDRLKDPKSKKITDALSRRLKIVTQVFKTTRVGMVLIGGLLAGVFSVVSSGMTWPPSAFQVLAVTGAVLAFVGGILNAFVEEDPLEQINEARESLVRMERQKALAETRLSMLQQYQRTLKQLENLYLMFSVCRGTLEQAFSLSEREPINIIYRCMEDCRHNLRIAMGYQMDDFWTVCVYQTVRDDPSEKLPYLKCVAQQRSVECNIAQARTWPIGVGIGGVALAKNDEVVEPDMSSKDVGSAFELDGGTSGPPAKPTDAEHYKSMFAVPISVVDDKEPWGVVVATNSRPKHFGATNVTGVAPEETVRSLAGIVAIAIAMCDHRYSGADNSR